MQIKLHGLSNFWLFLLLYICWVPYVGMYELFFGGMLFFWFVMHTNYGQIRMIAFVDVELNECLK